MDAWQICTRANPFCWRKHSSVLHRAHHDGSIVAQRTRLIGCRRGHVLARQFSLGKMPRASLLPRCNFNRVCRHAVTESVKVGDVAQQQQREIDLHRSIAAAESRGSEGAHQSRESPSVADSTGSWPTERRPYTRAIEGIKALLNDGVAFTRRCFGGLAVENLHHSAVISDKPCSLHRTSGKR